MSSIIDFLIYVYFNNFYIFISFYFIIYFAIYYKCNKFKWLRRYILAEVPIFQISQDKYSHEIKECFKFSNYQNFRISLFYLSFGDSKIYLFTYYQKFHFYKIISLKEMNQKEINDKKNKMSQIEEMNLNKFNAETKKENRELYIKVLEDKINEFEKIEDTAKLKGAFYIAIVAGIISATIGNIHRVKEIFEYNFFTIAIFIMLLIFFINMVILLFEFHSVKGYYSGMYSKFREEENKEDAYFLYLYRKMQWLQLYSTQDVSYILNIEDYIKSFFILITLLAFIFIFI